MTMIDRHTRFLVTQPIEHIDTLTVWDTLVNNWIKYFGCPQVITTDRGSQFDNPLFRYLCKKFNMKLNHTTAFHPASNGIVEREHRKIKNSLRALRDPDWRSRLPIVALCWNNAIRDDFLRSPSQLIYGTSTRLPIDFFETKQTQPLTVELAESYRAELDVFKSHKTCRHAARYPTFILPGLSDCHSVWVRNENRKGLDAMYEGPFEVLDRHENYFEIKRKRPRSADCPTERDSVHISRLKPAFSIGSGRE